MIEFQGILISLTTNGKPCRLVLPQGSPWVIKVESRFSVVKVRYRISGLNDFCDLSYTLNDDTDRQISNVCSDFQLEKTVVFIQRKDVFGEILMQ